MPIIFLLFLAFFFLFIIILMNRIAVFNHKMELQQKKRNE